MEVEKNIVNTIDKEEKKLVTLKEAACIHGVTAQAIYVAIREKKLKAFKNPTRWMIALDDLQAYRMKRYSRANTTIDGELAYDNEKGFYSVPQVAKMLNVPTQRIYYATRIGLMKAIRKRSAWVIHEEEIKKFQAQYLQKTKHRYD